MALLPTNTPTGTPVTDVTARLRVDGSEAVDGTGSVGGAEVSFGTLIPGPTGPTGPTGPAGPMGATSMLPYSIPGMLEISTGVQPFPVSRDCTIIGCLPSVGIAPVGSSVVYDVKVNGATIYTTRSLRPKVLAGETVGAATVPDVVALVAGDLITVDVNDVGTFAPGYHGTLVIEVV